MEEKVTESNKDSTIQAMCFFTEMPEDVVRMFYDKSNNLPDDFFIDDNGEPLGLIDGLKKLERVMKIKKVSKLSR